MSVSLTARKNTLSTSESVFANGLLEQIRGRFCYMESDPYKAKRAFFESAGGTLKLQSVVDETMRYTMIPDNDGRNNTASKMVKQAIDKGRSDVALFLGAKSGKIISEQSTTSMVFRILCTIAREVKGRNLIASELDHPCTYDGSRVLADRHNLEFRATKLDHVTGEIPVQKVLSLIDEGTVVLSIIHASNVLGTKNNVTEIVKQARRIKPDLYIVIDGAQHACHGLIDVEEYGADAWIFPPYKVYSKLGASFAHISDRLANLKHEKLVGKPSDFWDLGTREPASFAGMSAVVDYYCWLGSNFTKSEDKRTQITAAMKAIQKYEQELLIALLNGIGNIAGMLDLKKVEIIGQISDLENREAILAFNIKGYETSQVVEYFEKNGIRLHNRISDAYSRHTLNAMRVNECVRISLCHYNSLEEVRTFLNLLAKL